MEQQNHISGNRVLGKYGYDVTENNTYMFTVIKSDGTKELLDSALLRQSVAWACQGYEAFADVEVIVQEALKNLLWKVLSPDATARILTFQGKKDLLAKLPPQPHRHDRVLYRECIVPLWDAMSSSVGTVVTSRRQSAPNIPAAN